MARIEAAIGGRTTLRDVADRVGVSINTASFVLNGSRSGTRVSVATREALESAARDLGYRPNEVARALRRQRTRLLGFFSQFEALSAHNGFLAEMIGGAQRACADLQHDLVLHSIPFGGGTDDLVEALSDRRIDGLILFAPGNDLLADALVESRLPAISVAEPLGEMRSVVVDDEEGGRLQARHLAEGGHRRIVYRGWYAPLPSAVARERGFRDEAARLGMTVVGGRTMAPGHEGGLTAIERAALPNVTAFACWTDDAARWTCDVLAAEGFRVPEDVAVVGYNGIPLPCEPRWRLTTVHAPWREVGETAVRRLLRVVDGQEAPTLERLPVHLVPGSTT